MYDTHSRFSVTALFVCALIVTGLFALATPSLAQSAPANHWSLNENTGSTANDTAGSANGTLINGTGWDSGKIGFATRFDGTNDQIDLGNINVSGNTMSISAWINADDFASHPEGRILAKASSPANNDHYWMISSYESGNKYVPRFRLKTGTTTSTLIGLSAPSMQTGQWYHIVATYDGSTMRLYQDGVEVGSLAKTGNIAQSSSVPAAIGDLPNGSRPFDGLIDDLCVFDTALTPSEIDVFYNFGTGSACGSTGPNQAPVADAGADITATDTNGNGFATVTLDATASFDSDGFVANFRWLDGGTIIHDDIDPVVPITRSLSVGVHNITLLVTDDQGLTDTDTMVVTVN